MRQIHHWSAMLFIAAMFVHLMRVYFTGAFRKPRELNWVVGCLLLLLGMLEGFTGYSLPDDLLSGTGIRAADGFIKSQPIVGTYMSFFLFDGEFPGEAIIPRLYAIHILLIPGILLALVGLHMLLLVYHKHTQWPGPGKTEQNVVGFPLLPIYAAKAGGFFFVVFGVTALMGAFLSINPVWKYGPYDPSKVTAGSQPDWYMGWPDGALRIMPGWESHLFTGPGGLPAVTLSWNVLLPIIVLPMVMFVILMMLPFIESWITGDKREHHLLQRPRNAPDPDGHDGRVDDVRRHPLDGRRQRHHRHPVRPEHQPDHLLQPRGGVRRSVDRVLHHPALVHLAATARPGEAPPRLRDRRHHALPRGRLLREAPAAARGHGLHPDRAQPRRDLHASSPTPTATASPHPDRASRRCAPGSVRRSTPTTSRSRPVKSSTRPTTTPSTSTSSQAPMEGHVADGHQFDGHRFHDVDEEPMR